MMSATSPAVATEILTGYGTGGFPIKTSSHDAQMYFDNGMQLAHAFAHGAAAAAFRKAEALDPSCAMCVWGEAWARGPSINFSIDEARQMQLRALTEKAGDLAKDSSSLEKRLVLALELRYVHGGGSGDGDYAYAREMDAIANAYPNNELKVMAADAWMIPASLGNNRDHVDRAIEILETGLSESPDDTGLIHFYMHATEMDGVGAEALPYAEKLPALAPSASHLVHMPSHVYFRLGRFKDAVAANVNAVAIDKGNAARLHPAGGVFGLGYHSHNVAYGEAAALLDNDRETGLSLAKDQLEELPNAKADNFMIQLELGTALFVVGRYGSTEDIRALGSPTDSLPYVLAMWHYALGEAAVRGGLKELVRNQISDIRLSAKDAAKFQDSAPQAAALVEIAQLVLTARLRMLQNNFIGAEAAYRKAAEIQETKLTTMTDPPAWWYPIRRSVGAALLAQGRYMAARIEVLDGTAQWPNDPLSLRILADCAGKTGDDSSRERLLRTAQSNWAGSIELVPIALI